MNMNEKIGLSFKLFSIWFLLVAISAQHEVDVLLVWVVAILWIIGAAIYWANISKGEGE